MGLTTTEVSGGVGGKGGAGMAGGCGSAGTGTETSLAVVKVSSNK